MVTLFVSTAPHRRELQEVIGHIVTLEQAARAVHEGYLGHLLYHQAAYTAQRLLALVETMEWDEGIRIAHEIACLFQTVTAFGLVQALHKPGQDIRYLSAEITGSYPAETSSKSHSCCAETGKRA